MYLFGGNKVDLATATGLNTLRFRESRGTTLARYRESLYNVITKDITTHSLANSLAELHFNFVSPDFCKKVTGLADVTSQERDTLLTSLALRLKEDKFETYVDGTMLKVIWTVPELQPL